MKKKISQQEELQDTNNIPAISWVYCGDRLSRDANSASALAASAGDNGGTAGWR
jgi:hypothetical protein